MAALALFGGAESRTMLCTLSAVVNVGSTQSRSFERKSMSGEANLNIVRPDRLRFGSRSPQFTVILEWILLATRSEETLFPIHAASKAGDRAGFLGLSASFGLRDAPSKGLRLLSNH